MLNVERVPRAGRGKGLLGIVRPPKPEVPSPPAPVAVPKPQGSEIKTDQTTIEQFLDVRVSPVEDVDKLSKVADKETLQPKAEKLLKAKQEVLEARVRDEKTEVMKKLIKVVDSLRRKQDECQSPTFLEEADQVIIEASKLIGEDAVVVTVTSVGKNNTLKMKLDQLKSENDELETLVAKIDEKIRSLEKSISKYFGFATKLGDILKTCKPPKATPLDKETGKAVVRVDEAVLVNQEIAPDQETGLDRESVNAVSQSDFFFSDTSDVDLAPKDPNALLDFDFLE